MSYDDWIIIAAVLVYFYPFVHGALRFVGEFIFKKGIILKSYIRLINIIYLPICLLVLIEFTIGDFSILSGWKAVFDPENSEILDQGKLSSRQFLGLIFIIIVPIVTFLMSIIWLYASFDRIRNPEEIMEEGF